MKNLMKKSMIMVTMLVLVLCCSVSTQAKAKKLTVNTVYTTAKKVTGTTILKKAKVTAQIGSKIYAGTSGSKGKFTIKIPKQRKSGKKITVTVYNTDGTKYVSKAMKVKKRLTVNTVYTTSTKVKGTTKWGKKWVKVKIGKVIYWKKADRKGNYSVKIPKQAKNTKITVAVYKKKSSKRKYKYVSTSVKVKVKSKVPKKTDPIDEKQLKKDIEQVKKTGKAIDRSIDKVNYVYEIWSENHMNIGYPIKYIELNASGSHVTLKAKNGITLYYTIGANGNFDFAPPTLTKYDGILKSGQMKKWQGSDFKKGELPDNNLYTKIYGYMNGKLIVIRETTNYLLQGYSDNDKYYID